MCRPRRSCCVLLLAATVGVANGLADDAPGQPTIPRAGLAVRAAGRGGRSPFVTDAVEALRVAGRWKAPAEGETLTLADGTAVKWEKVTAGADGSFTSPSFGAGGYLYLAVPSGAQQVMILEASGHGHAVVNGEPRAGDPYGYGYVRLPVLLRAGTNEFLFQGARGRSLRARLVPAKADAQFDLGDCTLPDLLVGEAADMQAAVVVLNNRTEALDDLVLRATVARGPAVTTPVPYLLPCGVRKVGFRLRGPADTKSGRRDLKLELAKRSGETLDTATLSLRVQPPDAVHKRTFVSGLDGSVQYYAVNPARPLPGNTSRPALFLTLHGAGVEALGQAAAYSPKSWGHLVAPTNRRPFGFDWEDWGRLDAIEVLDIAQKTLRTDPRRTYLTGHSMGGHGVWHIGATFPDRFAALGPSAGWVSFFSYAGARRAADPSPVQELLQRAMAPSDTLTLVRNYAHHGVYVLHGGADDNVPPREARQMTEQLGKFHHDFQYHEQPKAGHWWDVSDEPGTDCVDWAPLFDFFARRQLPDDECVRYLDFTTANPGVSFSSHWVGIEAQTKALRPSRVILRYDPGKRRFVGTTENVARLSLRLDHVASGAALTVEMDGTKLDNIPYPEMKQLWLTHAGSAWVVAKAPESGQKTPLCCGPFKEAFHHRVQFVYGTRGTPEENTWALTKARFDAEMYWYRGNASINVLPDTAFDADKDQDRNVILYGNADTNGAWAKLLAKSPVQAHRGLVSVGAREDKGDDLGYLFVRPRPGSDVASIGVVGGTGVAGMRLTDRLPYVSSGTAYSDFVLFGPEVLSKGGAGVRGAGYFGLDWGVEKGEFAWK